MKNINISPKIKVVCDDKVKFLTGVIEPYANVVFKAGSSITRNDLLDAQALIVRTRTKCNKDLLEGTSVKFIGTATIGFDHIDTSWVEKSGIEWTNAPGCNSGSVKQYVAAALALLVTEKKMLLEGKTIGIVGVGNVGKKVAQVAKAFGMKVLLNDPPRQRSGEAGFVSYEEVLSNADIITYHVPYICEGVDKTFHLFDDSTLKKVRQGVVIINTSRGEVVDTQSLKSGLKSAIVSNAILDVWENEPNIDLELLKMTFIATPHIAGYSVDGKAMGSAMTVRALATKFGLPLTNWYPENIPTPESLVLEMDCNNLSDEEILSMLILNTHDLRGDDFRLRNDVINFESLRGSYPVRREFHAYFCQLVNSPTDIKKSLDLLGFKDY